MAYPIFIESFLALAFRLAVVITGELDTVTQMFYERNIDVFTKHGIEIFFAKSPADALAWYEERKIPHYS